MLAMSLINNCHIQSIYFVLSFPQAPLKTDIYIKPPKLTKAFEIPDLPNFTDHFIYVYNLVNNLYGVKDAEKRCYDYVKNDLLKQVWHQ